MSQAPVMPVFTDALLGDTMHLSAEEFGAYCLLLFATWRNNGQPLSDDAKRLARVCRLPVKRWPKMREELVKFFDVSDGTWRQKRLEKEWENTHRVIELRREFGALGGHAKALRRKDTALAKATDLLENGEDASDSQSVQIGAKKGLVCASKFAPNRKGMEAPKALIDNEVALAKATDLLLANGYQKASNPYPYRESSLHSDSLSEAKASAVPPSAKENGEEGDLKKVVFDTAVRVLMRAGASEAKSREMAGKWRKALHDDGRLVNMFLSAEKHSVIDPISYISKAVQQASQSGGYRPMPSVAGG